MERNNFLHGRRIGAMGDDGLTLAEEGFATLTDHGCSKQIA